MPFLVFGGDPFVHADLCEMLEAEYPGEPVVAAATEEELRALLDVIEGPIVALLAIHNDVVRFSEMILKSGERPGAIILIRNDPPTPAEAALPLHHLTKPFSSRELLVMVRNVRADLPAFRS